MLFLHPSRSPPGPGLYILSPRFVSRDREISIHALRVEGDCTVPRLCRPYSAFLSTPSGWRATYEVLCKLAAFLFLSTPSGWRATSYGPCNSATVLHFYPRPPGGGDRKRPRSNRTPQYNFYPRPPGGGRRFIRFPQVTPGQFLSTPPGGGRLWRKGGGSMPTDFYPRLRGGGRQQKRTKFSSVFAQKGEEFASLRRGKREFAGGVLKRTNFRF